MPQQRSVFLSHRRAPHSHPLHDSLITVRTIHSHTGTLNYRRTSRAVTTPEVIYLTPNTQAIPASSLNCVCGAAALLQQNAQ